MFTHIDEPYQRETTTKTSATTQPTAIPGTAITPAIASASGVTLAAGMTADAFNVLAKHKLKEKEAKKEKKKKRHKERPTKDEDINGKTNKTRDKEKLELNETTKDTASNEQDIEIQILWLEKIYTLNKQLQKEEELAAKLHAKVRKHQLRKAQQTQREVQMEIDKLDDNLALQCGDIRKVEANLMQTNEQLQRKLLILERLSIDYLEQQQQEHKQQSDGNETHKAGVQNKPKEIKEENPLKNDPNNILTSLEKSLDIQKLSLKNIQSKDEVKKLEKIIAKPAIDLHTEQQEAAVVANATAATAVALDYNYSHNNNNVAKSTSVPVKNNGPLPAFNASHNLRFSNEYTNRLNEIKANTMSGTSNLTNCNAIVAAATVDNQQQTHTKPQLITALTTGVTGAATDDASNVITNTTNVNASSTVAAAAATKTETLPAQSSVFIDKNMLSSLHVQNAKTIKKQMFHTQTTATAQTLAIQQKVPALALAPSLAPAPAPARALSPAATALLTSAFPKQQFQHVIPQQHIPKTTLTYLTSRPQNSHQILLPQQQQQQLPSSSSNIIFLQHHPSNSMATIATSSLSSSSAPVSSTLIVSPPPPASISPSPSIMAMNTVDISQLGTLV